MLPIPSVFENSKPIVVMPKMNVFVEICLRYLMLLMQSVPKDTVFISNI